MDSFAWRSWTVPLLHHLWQSTVFAGGVWLLALALRQNAARVRYRLWMAASLKFLVPFSLLIAAGARLSWPTHLRGTQPAITAAVEGVTQPLLQVWPAETSANLGAGATGAAPRHSAIDWLPLALVGVWVGGTLLLVRHWAASWLRLRMVVRRGEPITLAEGTKALLTMENVEPGVFGMVQPVLVLPRGIAERLSAEQLDAIVVHEMCHIRRRDNLTAALHMTVEALFWFHPLVWWLQARLLEERERACDEAVLETTHQPFAYAEGILNVCKFYVEAPLSCMSGVAGSELKQRIARILSGQGARKLDLRQKVLLALACALAVGVPLAAGLVRAAQGQTQGSAAAEKGGIAGTWQGTMHTPDGHNPRMVLKIAKDEKGVLSATLYNLDQKGPPMAGSSVTFDGGTLRFVNDFPRLIYEGKISADGNSIRGTVTQVTQNGSLPLVLERATPEKEWATPAPPPSRTQPMAPDAKPGVEVATVKPTQPGTKLFMLTVRGEDLVVKNLSLTVLMKFAYPTRPIVGFTSWMDTDKWDIEVKPDTPGTPGVDQEREILQKLLAERFALKVHEEKREMPAYALTVGKDAPKMTKSADASLSPNFALYPSGMLHAQSATMDDFARLLQSNVLGQQVVDETGLTGKWDFVLQWTPDETQFAGMRMSVPTAADDANAPPPLVPAIREQLGLQLKSEKTQVPVLVIDHVGQPSPN
jgi:uncharacterized protein (TIGR03435 family)